MYVEIGNDKAIEGYRDPQSDDPDKVRYRPLDGQRVTQMSFPDGIGLQEAFQSAVTAFGYHIADGESPAWVESDSPGLETLLKEHFGITEGKTRPKAWGKETGAAEMPKPGAVAEVTTTLMFAVLSALLNIPLLGALLTLLVMRLDLRTNAGRDFQARVMGDTSSNGTGSYAPGTYIALTANATAPAAGDTTLTAELTGTLARAVAVYAHTNGTATYTLTKTFTSDQTVVVAKIGVFNASSSGTLVFTTLLNATASLVSGDQLQITETVTL